MIIQRLYEEKCPNCGDGFVVRVSYKRPATLIQGNRSMETELFHVIRECYDCRHQYLHGDDHDHIAEAREKARDADFHKDGEVLHIKLGY